MLSFVSDGLQLWSTQNPLRWNLYHPDDATYKLIDTHVNLGPAYKTLRAQYPAESDFQIIDRLLRHGSTNGELAFGSAIADELRNYLCLSLSYFQLHLADAKIGSEYPKFPWTHWLRYYADNLAALVSFNYDSVRNLSTILRH